MLLQINCVKIAHYFFGLHLRLPFNKTGANRTPKQGEESLKIHSLSELFTKTGIKKYLGKVLRLKAKPWRIALSIGLGVFIGLAIPMGFQTIIVIPLALLLQCNIFLTISATLVSNPLTVVPLYYLNFKIGEVLTALSISNEQIELIISSPTFENLQEVGFDALILFFSGSFTQGLLFGFFAYLVSLQFIKLYRQKKKLHLR